MVYGSMANRIAGYPGTPPAWLPTWPEAERLAAQFAEGVRRLGLRLLALKPPRDIRWTEFALAMEVGGQFPAWRRPKGKDCWEARCGCGFPGGKCPHLYAASIVFGQIASAEQWLPANRGSAPTATAGSPYPRFGELRNPQLYGTRPRIQGDLFAQAEVGVVAADRPARLEVEIDLGLEPGKVGVRFYHFAGDRRQLLKMQQLHRLAMTVRHSYRGGEAWSDADRQFLAWLAGSVLDQARLARDLNLLKLTRPELARWQERWAGQPGRFIERATQQPLVADGGRVAAHIELTALADGVEIALVVPTPSGRSCRFHELGRQLAGGQGKFLIDGQTFAVDFPVSRELLLEVFAERAPVVPREKICANLPILLQNRLECVAGPAVRQRTLEKPLAVTARGDGGDVCFAVQLGGKPCPPGCRQLSAGIVDDGRQFTVTLLGSQHLPAVRAMLLELGATADEQGGYRMAARLESMRQLVACWQALPAAVHRQVDASLAGLFGAGQLFEPVVNAVDRGGFVDLNVVWRSRQSEAVLSATELAEAARRQIEIVRTRAGHWLRLDTEAMKEATDKLAEFGFDDGGHSRLLLPEAATFFKAAATPAWALAPDSRDLASRLQQAGEVRPPLPPLELRARLRHYQLEGFEFLANRAAYQVGAILADDMGLGKTVQVLALLQAFADSYGGGRLGGGKRLGALVVCPASVVGVWQHEASKFCPALRCRAYLGGPEARRQLLAEERHGWDLLVANYAVLRNDIETFMTHEFEFVILDEAQNIKNPEALVTRAVKQLRTPHPLAMTGTPIENRVTDLWSIMDFLNPGFLGQADDFKLLYDTPETRRSLARRIAPVVMRRTKQLVAPELPARTEETVLVELGSGQRAIYQRELVAARQRTDGGGMLALYAALTRLRQVCCDPRLLTKEPTRDVESAKLETLLEMIEEILAEGHSILVFSQFTSMLALIEARLRQAGIPQRLITGSTPVGQRPRIVAEFNASTIPEVFLLSLKAAGTGLTLTKADYVFLYDPWWNPAVENQAIDRTHRIGQSKPVFAYRLIAQGTIEEKVLALQQEKAELFAQVMADAEAAGVPRGLTTADLAGLLG